MSYITIEAMPAVKICRLINSNMKKSNQLRMELKWGYTNDGIIFDRIADRQGQTLHGQFYIGKNVIKQIAELHTDFSISLESFTNIRWATIRRRWDARKD